MPCIPGNALHEKDLQRQIGDGTLVSSLERRALAVPRINRGQTADEPRVLFPHWFTQDFLCSCFRRVVQDSCLRCRGWQKDLLSPGRTDPSASRPARSGPAPTPCHAPPRHDPPVGCPGFGLDKYLIFKVTKRKFGLLHPCCPRL